MNPTLPRDSSGSQLSFAYERTASLGRLVVGGKGGEYRGNTRSQSYLFILVYKVDSPSALERADLTRFNGCYRSRGARVQILLHSTRLKGKPFFYIFSPPSTRTTHLPFRYLKHGYARFQAGSPLLVLNTWGPLEGNAPLHLHICSADTLRHSLTPSPSTTLFRNVSSTRATSPLFDPTSSMS